MMKIANTWPEGWVMRSEQQKELERQGHIFNGQEWLDNHEIDPNKECYCGRQVRGLKHNPELSGGACAVQGGTK